MPQGFRSSFQAASHPVFSHREVLQTLLFLTDKPLALLGPEDEVPHSSSERQVPLCVKIGLLVLYEKAMMAFIGL